MKNRTENSIKNTIANLVCNIGIMIIGLVAQAIFIRILGAEYLGINGLFTNILSILGIAELGIGNAIIYNLYKPIANNDKETIKSLLKFYKKAYYLIAVIVLICGICIMPFLSYFVGENNLNVNLKLIYLIFLGQTVSTYILTYKTSIFIASQQNYKIKYNNLLFRLVLNVLQLILLYITKNYYLYLVIFIFVQLYFNYRISHEADKCFNYLNDKNVKKMDKELEKDIFTKIKALFLHKVGGFIVNGTDNIIISKFISVYTVGLYSNYYMIINAITTLFNQIISAVSASVGNLLVTENSEKIFDVFRKVRFLNYWIAVFSATSILCIINPFVKIWVGEQYVLSIFVVVILVFNFYQKMMRSTYTTFKDAAGIWKEDKIVPLIESVLNIIFSIICLKMFGLAGVFMGTIISGLALWCYSFPKFVYKKLFNRTYLEYIRETIGYIMLFSFIAVITYTISTLFIIDIPVLQVVINTIICLIIPNVLLFLVFRRTDNFKYFKDLLFNILNKFIKIKQKNI